MDTLESALSELTLEAPMAYANLTIFPLTGRGPESPGYLFLDEAVEQKTVAITEVDAGGSVPELKLTNNGDLPVLLLDGEELIGAKQNRVLNLTILAPAHSTVLIPVSCVEAGRWSRVSAEFAVAERTQFARARRSKMQHVSHSLAVEGSRRSDQSQVWEEIADKAVTMQAESPTRAMSAIYERHHSRVEDYVQAFRAIERQRGAIFFIDGQVIGLELFDSSAALLKLLPKLIRSYALDAIETSAPILTPASAGDATTLLSDVRGARVSAFKAVGLGQDVRLSSDRVVGGALLVEGRVIHLSAFSLGNDRGCGSPNERVTRFARASQRRRAAQTTARPE